MITTARFYWRLGAYSASLALLPLPGVAAADSCGAPATAIADVQGAGAKSPLAGQTVTVEAVLTQDSRYPGGFEGFYLQQSDHQTDADPATSEALFVYTRQRSGQPGDRLRVTGQVKEYHGLTELVGLTSLVVCGREALPSAVTLTLPWNSPPESLENMRVRFRDPLTVISSDNLARYGELTLAPSDQTIATEFLAPGPAAVQTRQRQRQQRVLLDDGRRIQQPRPIPWPPGGLSAERTVRAGDRMDQLAGVLDFRFGHWRLQPDATPRLLTTNPRLPPPLRPDQPHLRVLALNLGNYFDGNGQGEGFPSARGARSHEAFLRQQQRLRATLLQPDPDILALSEVENDGYGVNSSVATLTNTLGPAWRVVATPGQDGQDAIRSVLLYRTDRVTPVGGAERLTDGVFRHRGRPPISQVFRGQQSDQTVRIATVHLKSKSCRGASGADRDQNDGQGCYAQRRQQAAETVVDWLNQLPPTPGLTGTLLTGDLNAYARETPLAVFYRAGFTSMVHRLHPCNNTACPSYTYRYQGTKGSLDYALASKTLKPHILTATTWLLNSDEPRALAYDGPIGEAHALPWRSSDHNPVITDIRL